MRYDGGVVMGRLFGTDGVRGVANVELTPELAFQLGQSGAAVLAKNTPQPKILIGKDPRLSGAMLEAALIAGITSVGGDVVLLDVVPTPAVAYLTKVLQAHASIMISASHNPMEDNGIKFFAGDGFKLTDQVEDEIEQSLGSKELPRPIGKHVGRVYQEKQALEKYMDFLIDCVNVDLRGLHIALDCANGAAYHCAPQVLERLGAKVSVINAAPTGVNINVNSGSTHPDVMQDYVVDVGADIGITHDGDADRVLAVDERGNLVDGDHILAICGLDLLAKNKLPNKKIVSTVYSNGGLRQGFQQAGGEVVLTSAGDRYVLEAMIEHDLVLGGEQSGHIIFLDHNTTGDGVLTALKLLEVLLDKGVPLSELAQVMPVFPQVLTNVRVDTKDGWDQNVRIQAAIKKAESLLAPDGRIFVRASGTESLIRVMGEHPANKQLLDEVIQAVATVVQSEQGA